MKAYSELYVDDAMATLGEMCDHAVNVCKMDGDEMLMRFAMSTPGREFGKGNARYVSGMSGAELWTEVIFETEKRRSAGKRIDVGAIDRSREYWAGWVYAYYQWMRGIPFFELIKKGLRFSTVCSMYIYHEADLSAFVSAAEEVISAGTPEDDSALKRMRLCADLTQKALSERSGVSLRMIQLYEQGQNDIRKAQAQTVIALADALHCDAAELIRKR